MVGTRIRTLLELRSTVPAANNRLDLLSIKSYDQGVSTPLSLGVWWPLASGPCICSSIVPCGIRLASGVEFAA